MELVYRRSAFQDVLETFLLACEQANISFTSTSTRVFLLFYESKISCLSEVTK